MNDRKYQIAIGKNRFDTNWQNKSFTWEQIKSRLSKDNPTEETLDQFMKMNKDARDRIKDCGGFVGGPIRGRKRKKGAVISRSLITLDLDTAEPGFWDENFTVFNDYAALVYSTHSHTPEHPRLRLVIPLDRDCSPEEYIAVARKVAEDVGINQMDKTTYQVERLMYYPSHPRDAAWVFESQDGPLLSVDETLARYADWHDVSQYPTGLDEEQAVGYEVKKAADPLEKQGLIGAFNRTYTISEAIEKFLPDVYASSGNGRYTYVNGSSTNGAVVYNDDTILYSNHATDPAAGHAQNAYDLVRIHKFGELDRHYDGNPNHRRPSDKTMAEFVAADEETSLTLTRESAEACAEDFADIEAVEPTKKDSPQEPQEEASERSIDKIKLERDKTGKPKPTIGNFVQILEYDPALKNLGGKNEFTKRFEVDGRLPWDRQGRRRSKGSMWSDDDQSGFRFYCEAKYNLTGKDAGKDAVRVYFNNHGYHPVRQYLNSLVWDGKRRVERIFIDYLGAEDTEYVRVVTRKMMVAGVSRIYRPGCKWDYMLTLTGAQGIGKSTLFGKLGREWYNDSLTEVKTKDASDMVQGAWIVEMAELTATRKADVEAVKQFISKQIDIYRKAYGEFKEGYPRECIFVGTTNDATFLRDRTGNRRFWAVEVGRTKPKLSVWDDLTPEVVDQLWAEAKYYYEKGEPLYLDHKIAEQAEEMQERHVDNGMRDTIENYLDVMLPPDTKLNEWYNDYNIEDHRMFYMGTNLAVTKESDVCTTRRDRVCVIEIACEAFGLSPTQVYVNDSAQRTVREIRQIMDKLPGWKRMDKRTRFGKMYERRTDGYYRVGGAYDPDVGLPVVPFNEG